MTPRFAEATLGAGCFWCVEAVFMELRGVLEVESGYTGGTVKDPSYEEVCAGDTGHAEVVRLRFDPDTITFPELLDVFWHSHDPTSLNRQGNDSGTQYRSAIFYHDEAQRVQSESSKAEAEASGDWPGPIVTEISPLGEYYRAEDYHQDYFAGHGNQSYCKFVIAPKLVKLRKAYAGKLKSAES